MNDLQQEILSLLEELIAIPSTASRPGEILRCADFIASWLRRHDIDHQLEIHEGTPSIVVPASRRTKILLMSHFDVVEAEDSCQFAPYRQDGLLFGRGSVDDKYAVALSLILYREQLRETGGNQDNLCFGLLLTGDEEVGGRNGAGKAVETLETEYFIALDGGSPNLIVTKEKGVLSLRLKARGRAAHAARPWLGKSAFDILINDYQSLKKLFAEERDDHWHRTVVLSNCHAGNGSTNMVPDFAEATLNIRFTEHDDPQGLITAIDDCTTSAVIVEGVDAVFDSAPSPYLALLVHHTGGARVGSEHGASDAKFLSAKDIPGAIWGPNGNMSQHSDREHVEIATLFSTFDSLRGFVRAVQAGDGK